MRTCILFIIILTLISCAYTSLNPLSKLEDSQLDTVLYGVWYAKYENEEIFLHIGRSDEDLNLIHVVFIEHENGKIDDHAEFKMFNTAIDGNLFMNIILSENKDERLSYFFLKYEVEQNNKLIVHLLNPDIIEKAVDEKVITGVIKSPKNNNSLPDDPSQFIIFNLSTIEITDYSENIVRFLLDSDSSELYGEPMEFKRLNVNTN